MRGIDPTPIDRRADAYGLAVGVLGILAIIVAVVGTVATS